MVRNHCSASLPVNLSQVYIQCTPRLLPSGSEATPMNQLLTDLEEQCFVLCLNSLISTQQDVPQCPCMLCLNSTFTQQAVTNINLLLLFIESLGCQVSAVSVADLMKSEHSEKSEEPNWFHTCALNT